MIREMARIAVWGLASDRARLVETLHELGVIHLLQPLSEPLSSEAAGTFKRVSAKLLGLIEALEWKDWSSLTDDDLESARRRMPLADKGVVEELQRNLDEFSERLSRLQAERNELSQELQTLRRALRIAHHFDVFWKEARERGQEVTLWWIYRENQDELLSRLRGSMARKYTDEGPADVRHHEVRLDENDVVLSVAVTPAFAPLVEEIFKKGNAVLWKPPVEGAASFEEALEKMEARYREIPLRLQDLDEDIKKARNEWGPKLGTLYILMNERLEEVTVAGNVELEGNMVFLEGWVPTDVMDDLIETLRGDFGDRVLVEWRYPTETEWHAVPTALKNPPLFEPFELFLKLMPPVRYKGTDPTVLVGVFFPFFSGCMIGDVGYGAVISFLGLLFARKKARPVMSDIGKILLFVGAWSILWGVAYGELFGDLGHRFFHMEPLWVERSHVVLPVMVFTLGLGVFHVVLGLLLGFIQGIRNRQRHVWLEKLGNLVVLAGLIGAMVAIKGWLPDGVFTLSVTLLVVGIVLLLAGGGIGGLVESIGAVGNILSYVRIAAIGLSSAILALVATQFVDVFGVTLLGILVALAMHLLNFILALAGSGLHSARLQYVEFFGKFYSGGGKDYKPFARRRVKSWKKPS
ncbi:MAG: V-type ATP synthase subunit I [Thermovirgaceae bacterium]